MPTILYFINFLQNERFEITDFENVFFKILNVGISKFKTCIVLKRKREIFFFYSNQKMVEQDFIFSTWKSVLKIQNEIYT